MIKHLNKISTQTIKNILSENYTRGVDGKDYEQHKDELARILWKREDRQREILSQNREVDIDSKLVEFIASFKVFRYRLSREGNSIELRNDIRIKMNEYSTFCAFINN